jgi:predicted thioesterase
MSFLDPLLGAIGYGAEVTHLGAIAYGAEVRVALAQPRRRAVDVAPSSAPRSMAPSSDV